MIEALRAAADELRRYTDRTDIADLLKKVANELEQFASKSRDIEWGDDV